MSFTDSFNGSDNDALSGRPRWTRAFGAEALKVNANSQLKKVVTTTTTTLYLRPDVFAIGNGAEQRAKFDALATSTTAYGLGIFLSGTSTADLSGYVLNALVGPSPRITRFNGDGTNTVIGNNLGTLPNALGIELVGIVAADGSSVTLQIWQNGSKFAELTDPGAQRKTTGKCGLLINGAGTGAAVIDNYSDTGTQAPLTLSAAISPVPFAEGFYNTPRIKFDCVCTGVINVEAQLRYCLPDGGLGEVVPGYEWATKLVAPADGARSFYVSGALARGKYYRQIRDTANPGTVITDTTPYLTGVITIPMGQSLVTGIMDGRKDNPPVPAQAEVYVLYVPSAISNLPQNPTMLKVTTNADVGDGVKAMAAQWYADCGTEPLLINAICINGQSLNVWINDEVPGGGSGSNTPWTSDYRAWSGYAMQMLRSVDFRWTNVVQHHGAADIGQPESYPAKTETLYSTRFDTALSPGSAAFKVIIMPYSRSSPSANNQRMRNVQDAIGRSGGRYLIGPCMNDIVVDSNGSPHPKYGGGGTSREGYRMARAVSHHTVNPALDVAGPTFTASFSQAGLGVIRLNYDKPIKTAGGAMYQGTPIALPALWVVSSDDGSTFPPISSSQLPTATITGDAQVTLTSASPFPAGATRVDYMRGTPWDTDVVPSQAADNMGILSAVTLTADTVAGSGTVTVTALSGSISEGDQVSGPGITGWAQLGSGLDRPGTFTLRGATATATATGVTLTVAHNESVMEDRFFQHVICSREASFENGRGVPATPPLGIGVSVAAAGAATYATIPPGATVTLTKVQLSTLRVKDTGAVRPTGTSIEPASIRWDRQTGDLTGYPVDGLDFPINIV